MRITPTAIEDVLLIEPTVFRDERGWFVESYRQSHFAAAGIDCAFVQDNHARSVRHTLRGLHYQRLPGQAKLIRVTRGAAWDVAVDIRPGSPTFARWVATELSAERQALLFIPTGFAHGYVALGDDTEVQYKCSSEYRPEEERGIAYDDPDLAIAWPVAAPLLSARDRGHPPLRALFPEAFRGVGEAPRVGPRGGIGA
jgi:dTDP-4-dehydrorhamnose 3,5-epimerase